MDRRYKLLVLLLLFAGAYYFFHAQSYWAPGYSVRLTFDVNAYNVKSPFVEVNIAPYAGLSAHDLNDILVTDGSGNPLPFALDRNTLTLRVYAKGMTGDFSFYVFLHNPDQNTLPYYDLNHYYSLTTYQLPSFCYDDIFGKVIAATGLSPANADMIWYLAPDGKVHGLAWSGNPDDGHSVKFYKFTYDGSSVTYTTISGPGFQLYGEGTFVVADAGPSGYVDYLYAFTSIGGRKCLFTLEGTGSYQCLVLYGSFAGNGYLGLYLDNNLDIYPLVEVFQSYSSSLPRLMVFSDRANRWTSYSTSIADPKFFNPIASSYGRGGGLVFYRNGGESAVLGYPPSNFVVYRPSQGIDCGDMTKEAIYSNGNVQVGTCLIDGITYHSASQLSSSYYPVLHVGHCYKLSDGNYSMSPFIDGNGESCYFDEDISFDFNRGFSVWLGGVPNYVVVSPNYIPGIVYRVCVGSQSNDDSYHIRAAFRYDDLNTATPLTASFSALDVNDQNAPELSVSDVSVDEYNVYFHIYASDDTSLSRIEIDLLEDNDIVSTYDINTGYTSTFDQNITLEHNLPAGTAFQLRITAYDVTDKSSSEELNLTTPSPPPSIGGGGGSYTETTEQNQAEQNVSEQNVPRSAPLSVSPYVNLGGSILVGISIVFILFLLMSRSFHH